MSEVCRLPIIFKSTATADGSIGPDGIHIRKDMSQLHTIRTIANQIACVWLRAGCLHFAQLEIMAESVAFIVCKCLELDTSEFSFQHIPRYYNAQRDREMLGKLLDGVQKTALFFIDSLDGLRTARRIGYSSMEYFLFDNKKTAIGLFGQGYRVYLVHPDQSNIFVSKKKELEQHEGPFAVSRMDWFGLGRLVA